MPLSQENLSQVNRERVRKILQVIESYSRFDFSRKTEVEGEQDILAEIGAGVNKLGEELENSSISLKEKDQMLKEVHHRVKNNLQIISSLLNLQSENVLDQQYLDLISDSRSRISSMALVHEMLYASPDLTRIKMQDYIRQLSYNIHQSYSRPSSSIQFDFKIKDDAFFDVDHMIPIGLILNEIVSNSFKYAFPGNKGNIIISLQLTAQGYSLEVSDDGVGLPGDFIIEKDAHLGMQLIQMLTGQLEGTLRIVRDQGTLYQITFPA